MNFQLSVRIVKLSCIQVNFLRSQSNFLYLLRYTSSAYNRTLFLQFFLCFSLFRELLSVFIWDNIAVRNTLFLSLRSAISSINLVLFTPLPSALLSGLVIGVYALSGITSTSLQYYSRYNFCCSSLVLL